MRYVVLQTVSDHHKPIYVICDARSHTIVVNKRNPKAPLRFRIKANALAQARHWNEKEGG